MVYVPATERLRSKGNPAAGGGGLSRRVDLQGIMRIKCLWDGSSVVFVPPAAVCRSSFAIILFPGYDFCAI
jgi:hypothetical protein